MMTNSTKDVSDVLYALALAMPVPDAKTLDEFVRRYPQHAEALTEFAVQLALDPGPYGDEDGDETQDGAVSPAVSRAISHFQDMSFGPVMFHYAAETCKPHDVAKQHGFELAVDTMESQLADDDPLYVAYFENGCGDTISKWKPTAKDGWKLVGKSDHEDGPLAFYIRKIDETQK